MLREILVKFWITDCRMELGALWGVSGDLVYLWSTIKDIYYFTWYPYTNVYCNFHYLLIYKTLKTNCIHIYIDAKTVNQKKAHSFSQKVSDICSKNCKNRYGVNCNMYMVLTDTFNLMYRYIISKIWLCDMYNILQIRYLAIWTDSHFTYLGTLN